MGDAGTGADGTGDGVEMPVPGMLVLGWGRDAGLGVPVPAWGGDASTGDAGTKAGMLVPVLAQGGDASPGAVMLVLG